MTPGELQAALAKSRAEASGLSQSMIDAGKYVAELRAEVHTLRNAAALATERAEAEVAALRKERDAMRSLCQRTFSCAAGLTHYVGDRPGLRMIERDMAKIEADYRALGDKP